MLNKVTVDSFTDGGLNTDLPQWSLGPNFITSGLNFRIKDGKILSYYGRETLSANAYGATAGIITPNGETSATPQYYAAHSAGLLSVPISGTVTLGLTSAGNADDWTFARLGPIIIANSKANGAFYKLTPASSWVALPFKSGTAWGSAANKYGLIVRAHKTYLFMLGLKEAGAYLYDSFRWSHPADADTIPVTWDEADTAFIAGKAALGARSKSITDGLSLKESFIIYSEAAINVLYESGDGDIFGRNELTASTGLLRKECIGEYNGNHYLLCLDDFAVCDGSSIQSIASGGIQRHLAANVDSTAFAAQSFVAVNAQEKEVWFCVPGIGHDNAATLAYVYNTNYSTWSVRDIRGSSSEGIRGATWGYCPDAYSIYDRSLIGIGRTGRIYNIDHSPPVAAFNHEDSSTSIPAATVNATIERQNLKLADLDQEAMITSVRPMLRGKGSVSVYIGSHKYAGANVSWIGPFTFNIRTSDKIALRCSGKLFAWKIVGLSGAVFELNGLEFEVAIAGKR